MPCKWDHPRTSSLVGMLHLETGRWSTVHTLFKCILSSDLRALMFNSTSKPLLDRSFSFTVVRENVIRFPDKPRVPAKLLEQRLISAPPSRKAYVSTSGPPSAPLTLTGTIRRLTQGFPVPMAAHWPSSLALSTFTFSGASTVALSVGSFLQGLCRQEDAATSGDVSTSTEEASPKLPAAPYKVVDSKAVDA